MSDLEDRVRKAAAELHDAIAEAVARGLRIEWPANHQGLPAIAISETSAYRSEPAADTSVKDARIPPVAIPTKTE